jgi:hypothetical protein
MAPQKYTPDKPTFEQWLAEGLTHQQMADRVFELTGHRVTRAAITVALSGYGLTSPKPRYKELIPWRVATEHSKSYPVRMLRYLGRRNMGLPLTDKESALLDAWLRELQSQNLIVAYDSDDDQGFHYIEEQFRDHDDESLPIRKKKIHLHPDQN